MRKGVAATGLKAWYNWKVFSETPRSGAMRLRIPCLLIVLSSALPPAGGDVYVNNRAGDDHFTGAQPRNMGDNAGPARTLAKALRLVGQGDRVVLADTGQPYHDSMTLVGHRLSGTYLHPLVIDGGGATLDGSLPVPADRWEFYADNRFRFRPPQMNYHQLFLDGRPANRVATRPVSDVPPPLKPLQWCSHGGYIYFAVELSKLPADYKLSYACIPTGITLFHVDRVIIKDLTIQGFQVDGIQAQNSARRVTLANVTCVANGRSGVCVGGASQVDIDSCELRGNGVAQFSSQQFSEVHLRNSELRNDTGPGWIDHGGRVYLGERRVQGGLEVLKREKPVGKPEGKSAENVEAKPGDAPEVKPESKPGEAAPPAAKAKEGAL
jgi:hypothetical protein